MPTSLFLSGVAASFGARPLFVGLDLTLAPGDVTALVGSNGSGKTTLLRMIAGDHAPDAGTIRFSPPGAAVGYLPQSVPDAAESILDYALRRTGVGAAANELAAATTALADGGELDDRYSSALDCWLHLGGGDLEWRLEQVLASVGLDVDLHRPLGRLSGGQAARASLASVLVSHFDVLLLDEPTNNLDADGLALMTEFVLTLDAPVLIASHDRQFLDDVATSVLELDLHQQQVAVFAGGWSDYRAAKELAASQAIDAYERYEQQRADLVAEASRRTEWAAKGRAKAAKLQPHSQLEKKFREDRARRMDQRAARTRQAVERLEAVDQPRKVWHLRYSIAEAPESAALVCTLDRVVLARHGFRLGPVSADVLRGDRIRWAKCVLKWSSCRCSSSVSCSPTSWSASSSSTFWDEPGASIRSSGTSAPWKGSGFVMRVNRYDEAVLAHVGKDDEVIELTVTGERKGFWNALFGTLFFDVGQASNIIRNGGRHYLVGHGGTWQKLQLDKNLTITSRPVSDELAAATSSTSFSVDNVGYRMGRGVR